MAYQGCQPTYCRFSTFLEQLTPSRKSSRARGPQGTWVGVQNAIGNISRNAGPIVTGLIIDVTGSYAGGFWLAAGVALGRAAIGIRLTHAEVSLHGI